MIFMIWKISLRNILKHKIYSTINVFGLSLGFTAFILIGLFIRYELNWDKSNVKYDRIYRVQRHFAKTMYAMDGNDISPHTRAITAQLLDKKFPEFEKISVIQETDGKFLSQVPERQVFDKEGICADSCFFDIFTYKFLEGSQVKALNEPFTVVLSKKMADKLFGDKSALGETVTLEKKIALKVTGVYEDLPENSSLRPSYIISFSSLAKVGGTTINDIWSADCKTYALLVPGVNYKDLESKIKNVYAGFKGIELEELQLCPMKNLYLSYNGRKDYIIIITLYGFIGLFILIMSAFNYINLTTANASSRGKEVALKKVCGSSRFTLIVQFLGETLIIALIALIFAFEFASILLPVFSGIVDKQLTLNFENDLGFVGITTIISLIVGLVSAIYPALFLSSQKILSLFKGEFFVKGLKKFSLKNVLVTSQFAISVFLILITLAFSMQIRYLTHKDLGFNKENVLYTSMLVSDKEVTYDQLRNRILHQPEIMDASMSEHIPFVSYGGGFTNWEGGNPDDKINCRFNRVSYDFVKNLGIKIVTGRDFSRDFPGDIDKSCLINETAARCFGWDNPIGKKVSDNSLTVVGVMKNYIYQDMHNGIEPTILVLSSGKVTGNWTFAFRVDPRNMKKAKDILTNEFEHTFPNDPCEFHDLNSAFNNENIFKIYNSIDHTIMFFTVFNVFLAIIGLLGLVSFTIAKRTKEIGVRKINGSTSVNIFYILSREYLVMLFFALMIACPGALYAYEKLPGANKLHVQPWIFALGTGVILVIILLTTSYQTLKAATRNPVEALRYE
jgi:putative ABC transport system permease protein